MSTTLTVGMLRDMLATLDADMPVRLTMNMDLDDDVAAVYVAGGALTFDDNTSGLGPADGNSVLFNAFA